MTEKTCTKCGEIKGLEEGFYFDRANDQYKSHCKECVKHRARRQPKRVRTINRERQREYARRRRERHPDAVAEANRRWKAANPDKQRQYRRRYKAKRSGAPITLIAHSRRVENVDPGVCYWCGAPEPQGDQDHVLPLARGGADCEMNLVNSCVSCNRSKSAKHPLRWIAEQFKEAA